MTKYLGATDAFNAIVQKVDETLIQAEAHLRNLRCDAVGEKSAENLMDRNPVLSPKGHSERSCSPNLSRAPLIPTIPESSNSNCSLRSQKFQMKNKAYLSLDKKKGVVMTSFKSNSIIAESELKKVQKLIEDTLGKPMAASSVSSSSIETI